MSEENKKDDQVSVQELAKLVNKYQENNKPPAPDLEYAIFAEGGNEDKVFVRNKPSYRRQKQIDELRVRHNEIAEESKEQICKRHKWGEYKAEDGNTYYGDKVIDNDLSNIDFLEEVVKVIAKGCPESFDKEELDTGECEKMLRDFLLSCRA